MVVYDFYISPVCTYQNLPYRLKQGPCPETVLQHAYSCDGVRDIGSKEDGVSLPEC